MIEVLLNKVPDILYDVPVYNFKYNVPLFFTRSPLSCFYDVTVYDVTINNVNSSSQNICVILMLNLQLTFEGLQTRHIEIFFLTNLEMWLQIFNLSKGPVTVLKAITLFCQRFK